jgi:hypothetical protein
MPTPTTKRDAGFAFGYTECRQRVFATLAVLLALGCANGPRPTSATASAIVAPEPIVVAGVTLDEHLIRKALLRFTKVDESSFALVPVKSEAGTLSLSSRDASGKFVTVHFTMRNDDAMPTHVFPLLFKGVDLVDSEGKTYPVDKSALEFAASIPNIAPGKENSFYVFYDVPTGVRPRAVSFAALGTMLVFAR